MPTKKKKKVASVKRKTAAKKKPRKEVTKITRSFLEDLADRIHDPETGSFLRLCDGTMQNGPDPKNPRRPMHCGLGELYFAVTGRQPRDAKVSETDVVVDMVVDRAVFPPEPEINSQKALENALDELDISPENKTRLLRAGCRWDSDDSRQALRRIVNNVQFENDDGAGHGKKTSDEDFRQRSERVAKVLRQAAGRLA